MRRKKEWNEEGDKKGTTGLERRRGGQEKEEGWGAELTLSGARPL